MDRGLPLREQRFRHAELLRHRLVAHDRRRRRGGARNHLRDRPPGLALGAAKRDALQDPRTAPPRVLTHVVDVVAVLHLRGEHRERVNPRARVALRHPPSRPSRPAREVISDPTPGRLSAGASQTRKAPPPTRSRLGAQTAKAEYAQTLFCCLDFRPVYLPTQQPCLRLWPSPQRVEKVRAPCT